MIIHVCDKKKSISPYLKPCMTSNLISKSKKKNVIHDNKHYPMHGPLWQQREAEERGKESIRGCFFISCSHHSPVAVFTITCLLFSENPLRASTEEKGAVASHHRRLKASINHVLNPKNKERIRNIDRKGQQIVLIENVLFKVTTASVRHPL